jgi:hypothetical protein
MTVEAQIAEHNANAVRMVERVMWPMPRQRYHRVSVKVDAIILLPVENRDEVQAKADAMRDAVETIGLYNHCDGKPKIHDCEYLDVVEA